MRMKVAGSFLIGVGLCLLLVGLLLRLGLKLKWLGRLPGDIIIRRENFTFYFPLATSLLLSFLLSLILFIILQMTGKR